MVTTATYLYFRNRFFWSVSLVHRLACQCTLLVRVSYRIFFSGGERVQEGGGGPTRLIDHTHCAHIYQDPVQMASKCWMASLNFALITKMGCCLPVRMYSDGLLLLQTKLCKSSKFKSNANSGVGRWFGMGGLEVISRSQTLYQSLHGKRVW